MMIAPNLSVSQIRFVNDGGGYALWGNSFTLSGGGIEATNTAEANTINNAITLGASPVMVNVGSATSLTLAGALGGTGGLAKYGAGRTPAIARLAASRRMPSPVFPLDCLSLWAPVPLSCPLFGPKRLTKAPALCPPKTLPQKNAPLHIWESGSLRIVLAGSG
jgi:hypothetical protein